MPKADALVALTINESGSIAAILKSGEAIQSFVIDELALTKLLDKAWQPLGKKIKKQISSVIDFKKKTYNREGNIRMELWLEDDMYNESLQKIWKKITPSVKRLIGKSYERGITEEGENPFTLASSQKIDAKKSVSSVYAERKEQAIQILTDMVGEVFSGYASEVAIPDFHESIKQLDRINELWQAYERRNGMPLGEDAKEILRYEQARRLRIQALSKAQADVIDKLNESLTHNKRNAMMANMATARAHHFGFLDWATESGILYYRVVAVNDNRTCSSCAAMNGKTFSVRDAMEFKNTFMEAQGDKARLKELCPFLTSQDIDSATANSIDIG